MSPGPVLAVQYLENVPGVLDVPPAEVRARLRAAFERLPISHVLLGWNLPKKLIGACCEETARAGARFFLWHPLLAGDGVFFPRPEWRTIGLQGEPLPGFRDMPEFTFVCPNRSAAREAVLERLLQVIQEDRYDGVFLDRMRYPSPTADPGRWLACFCDDCRRAAAEDELDLEAVCRGVGRLLGASGHEPALLQVLFGGEDGDLLDPDAALLASFLDFRARSVSGFVREAAGLARAEGLVVGFDCFSPALTRMVGQDLGALAGCGAWIKVMTYGHALGPAGLPFELLALADWLVEERRAAERQALTWLSQASGLSLPRGRATLRRRGLSPADLGVEVRRGHAAGAERLLAGIELVEIEGVTHLAPTQIEADLRAFRAAGADGLVLSWDLWHIPLERLRVVGEVWN